MPLFSSSTLKYSQVGGWEFPKVFQPSLLLLCKKQFLEAGGIVEKSFLLPGLGVERLANCADSRNSPWVP